MASSDDEVEAVPESVTNYHFVDEKDEPIPFSVLPIRWSEDESSAAMKKCIFLHGTTDGGLQKIFKQVTAWKLELSFDEPKVSVLSKKKNWIKLQKPRKSFEDTIRTILITVHCLHFVKNNPDASGKSLWSHLQKVFSLYQVGPEKILLDHLPFISAAVKHDETLAKSKFIRSVLENHKKRQVIDEDIHNGLVAKKTKFVVDDSDEEIEVANGDESDEKTDQCDDVCSICDNGGYLVCCDGICFRSFHATLKDGARSYCKSLDLSKAQVKAIQKFVCQNCQYKQHQCFACGKLGSSDKSLDPEVFPCVSATCGHFYHPECVAKLLHPESKVEEEQLKQKIAAGESFCCPLHKCLICKQGENKEVHELQFAMCRRCPTAFHRKCLPREIAFKDLVEKGIIRRAWDDLLPKRILIYCLKHKIKKKIATPIRNHIIFPSVEKEKKEHASDLQSSQRKIVAKMSDVFSEDSAKRIPVNTPKQKPHPSYLQSSQGNVVEKMGNVVSKDSSERIPQKTAKQFEKVSSAVLGSDSTKKCVEQVSGQGFDFSKKPRIIDASRILVKDRFESISKKVDKFSTIDESKVPLKDKKSNSVLTKSTELVKSQQQGILCTKFGKTVTYSPVEKKSSGALPLIDSETEKRLEALKREKASSMTLEKVNEKHKVPSTHGYPKSMLDKAITQGKVGGSVEIVDKVHWYAQNGDMIVDICCGANDFSCLLKWRLEETGKKCSFKNYDVVQPKNNVKFEKRNWMTVHSKELCTGSQLIIALNTPSGVKANVVNMFIEKALEFKPKLLILVVPKETERLDEKEAAYDLVWEDGEKISGKALNLHGSVEVNDTQMEEWNLKPPVLYLWSRPDWTTKHRAIAFKCGHISKEQKISNTEENHKEPDKPMEEDHNIEILDQINDHPERNNEAEGPEDTRTNVPKHINTVEKGSHDGGCGKSRSCEDPKDRQDDVKLSRGNTGALPEDTEDHGRPHVKLSSMQQHASHLNESNHAKSTCGILGSQNCFHRSTFGFVPGPLQHFFQNSSCGWLDE